MQKHEVAILLYSAIMTTCHECFSNQLSHPSSLQTFKQYCMYTYVSIYDRLQQLHTFYTILIWVADVIDKKRDAQTPKHTRSCNEIKTDTHFTIQIKI